MYIDLWYSGVYIYIYIYIYTDNKIPFRPSWMIKVFNTVSCSLSAEKWRKRPKSFLLITPSRARVGPLRYPKEPPLPHRPT